MQILSAVAQEMGSAALSVCAESPRTKEAARSAVGVSERNQRQAVEEVEIALAVMQVSKCNQPKQGRHQCALCS